MTRIPALDGLRGVLAAIVVLHHLGKRAGFDALSPLANMAVLCFFVMSGYVLALAYDGRPFVFLAKRAVRLWPVYATCMVAGFALLGRVAPLADLLLWPPSPFARPVIVDLPDWSLYLEFWLSPALLGMFWIVGKGRGAAVAMVAVCAVLTWVDLRMFASLFFAIGVGATRLPLVFPRRMPAWVLWLGKVSYSLYLSHWIVISACLMAFGPAGDVVAAVMVLPVSWVLWRLVERPSIGWSRSVGTPMLLLKTS